MHHTYFTLKLVHGRVYIQVNKQMSYLYMAVRVVGYMIRYILVPVLIADPRATMVLLAYMSAYLAL